MRGASRRGGGYTPFGTVRLQYKQSTEGSQAARGNILMPRVGSLKMRKSRYQGRKIGSGAHISRSPRV